MLAVCAEGAEVRRSSSFSSCLAVTEASTDDFEVTVLRRAAQWGGGLEVVRSNVQKCQSFGVSALAFLQRRWPFALRCQREAVQEPRASTTGRLREPTGRTWRPPRRD